MGSTIVLSDRLCLRAFNPDFISGPFWHIIAGNLMYLISKMAVILFVVSFIVIPVVAVEDEEIPIVMDNPDNGDPYVFLLTITVPEEFPYHANLSPFFRIDDVNPEDDEVISEDITAWFLRNESVYQESDVNPELVDTHFPS